MLISGIQKFTLLDYPDKTSCIIFTPGCNFRCGFCHNPEFVLPELIDKIKESFISEQSFFNFLSGRKGLLDGVVITGGEPTIMPDLADFIKKIKDLGFLVKLDTNGSRPEVVKDLLDKKLIDYIAMDVKTSLDKYQELTAASVDTVKIKASIDLIKNSGVPYEFRATILKETHPKEVLEKMAELLRGADRFYLQTFRPTRVLDAAFEEYHPFSIEEMGEIAERFKKSVKDVGIR
jgi:pyruvate formate lyase activating enzyme